LKGEIENSKGIRNGKEINVLNLNNLRAQRLSLFPLSIFFFFFTTTESRRRRRLQLLAQLGALIIRRRG
jgi:hypothetical protein